MLQEMYGFMGYTTSSTKQIQQLVTSVIQHYIISLSGYLMCHIY